MTPYRFCRPRLQVGALMISIILLAVPLVLAQDWSQNLGPTRNGLVSAADLQTKWTGKDAPLAWRANTGLGSAPVIVTGGRVYTFGAFKRGTQIDALDDPASVPTLQQLALEGKETGLQLIDRLGPQAANLSSFPSAPADVKVRAVEKPRWYFAALYAQCFDAVTGTRIWATKLSDLTPVSKEQPQWPLASPLFVDGKVFFHGPTGDLFLVDADTGQSLWTRSLLVEGLIGEHGKQANAGGGFLWKETILVHFRPSTTPSRVGLMAVKVADGTTVWVQHFPHEAFRAHFTRFGFAMIEGQPTVLLSLGTATCGVNPDDGTVRWTAEIPKLSKELYEQRFQELSSRWADDEVVAKQMRAIRDVSGNPAPYPAYAPVAWQDHVIDAVMFAHDDFTSQMWCVRIRDNKPELVWQTLDTVPECHSDKSNLLAQDGRLYVFDQNAYGARGLLPRTDRLRSPAARPFRGADVGQFQCFDIATGQRLFHSNLFRTERNMHRDDTDHYKLIAAGDQLIVTGNDGVWIARLKADGVELEASASLGDAYRSWTENMNAEPVLVDRRLYLRQATPHANDGFNRLFSGTGNLFCFDLQTKP
jgi:hypothetical protein